MQWLFVRYAWESYEPVGSRRRAATPGCSGQRTGKRHQGISSTSTNSTGRTTCSRQRERARRGRRALARRRDAREEGEHHHLEEAAAGDHGDGGRRQRQARRLDGGDAGSARNWKDKFSGTATDIVFNFDNASGRRVELPEDHRPDDRRRRSSARLPTPRRQLERRHRVDRRPVLLGRWRRRSGSGGGFLSGLGDFFGGFFADGGRPPVGKPASW